MFCKYCGKEIQDDASFCMYCGQGTNSSTTENRNEKYEKYKKAARDAAKNSSEFTEKAMDTITEKINEMAGGEGAVDLRLKDLFSDVLKKHAHEEAEDIFICGTSKTTPKVEEISTSWPKPWLYTRVGLIFGIATMLIFLCCNIFYNDNALPGFIILGSFLMPLVVLIFFFEVNAPRNITFYEVIGTFLVGGCASLLVTLFFFEIFPYSSNHYVYALLIGIIEELGKVCITAFVIKRSKKCKYILNGMLLGGAVGAGFAAFESAGYALRAYFGEFDGIGGLYSAVDSIVLRGVLAPGGHVAWTAIAGVAIMLSIDKKNFSWRFLSNKKFYPLFLCCVVMHGIWDMGFGYLAIAILIAAAWIILLVLINTGLKEINNITAKAKKDGDEIKLHVLGIQ